MTDPAHKKSVHFGKSPSPDNNGAVTPVCRFLDNGIGSAVYTGNYFFGYFFRFKSGCRQPFFYILKQSRQFQLESVKAGIGQVDVGGLMLFNFRKIEIDGPQAGNRMKYTDRIPMSA